ncbi:preprotein translocase SecF subunit [Rhizomicrobium palustre]|uniref:Protein-export membrane protein SecF n=1 Tax=Rhizomicrobium palustre TaxID=189966 RepID=A0A846MZZ2_9PROT|nr:protein translocase subunit SecF [Rhizomicrobium palustre]NIK89006.1 preprotein translocase SecF subunit [Rhizomicrobium palustre]
MPLLRFIPEATNINFIGARYVAFAIDGLLLLAAVVSIAWHGFNLGLDFTGGVQVQAKAPYTISTDQAGQIRDQISTLHFNDQRVQTVSGGVCATPAYSCVMIRVQPKAGQDYNAAAQAIKNKLGPSYQFPSTEVISAAVSAELLHAGILASILAVICIALWVAFRFEWQYGISAAFATGHDVFVTAGLFSLLHLDFNLTSIAALLTLAGYSINDTVVVFDRLRENRRKYKRMPLADLINLSTNQMLTRTILTSVSTALSIIPLYFFVPALEEFTGSILFGILVGTFSSIYVAAALLLYLPKPAGAIEDKPVPAQA